MLVLPSSEHESFDLYSVQNLSESSTPQKINGLERNGISIGMVIQ